MFVLGDEPLWARMSMLTYAMFFVVLAAILINGQGVLVRKTTKKPRIHPLVHGELGITREFSAWVKYIFSTGSSTSSTPAPYIKNITPIISDGGFFTLGICFNNTRLGKCHVLQWKPP